MLLINAKPRLPSLQRLHYLLDRWAQPWRKRHSAGQVIMVRYADDSVFRFEYMADAGQFLAAIRERMAQFGLALHPDKTRLIECGRFAIKNRQRRGEGKPETFDFLGFTHCCSTTRKGGFKILRRTVKKRMRAALGDTCQRRSQRHNQSWARFGKLEKCGIPPFRNTYPYSEVRFRVKHPSQEPCAVIPLAGICAGAEGDLWSYRDPRGVGLCCKEALTAVLRAE